MCGGFPAELCVPPGVPRALNVTLVLQCERWRFVRVGLAVPLLGTVAELREMVAREGHIPPEQVTGTREGTPLLGDTDSAVPQCWGRGRGHPPRDTEVPSRR